jgi:hypothetical protein
MFLKRWREAFRKRQAKAQQVRQARQKQACVENQMTSLLVRHEVMTPRDIITELYRMHGHSEMPIYYCAQGCSLSLLSMLEYIGAHADCTAEDAERLAQMLLWPEVKRFIGDNSCRIAILDICEAHPTTEVFRIMEEHHAYVREQLEGQPLGQLIVRGCGSADLFMEPMGGNIAHWHANLVYEAFRLRLFIAAADMLHGVEK